MAFTELRFNVIFVAIFVFIYFWVSLIVHWYCPLVSNSKEQQLRFLEYAFS